MTTRDVIEFAKTNLSRHYKGTPVKVQVAAISTGSGVTDVTSERLVNLNNGNIVTTYYSRRNETVNIRRVFDQISPSLTYSGNYTIDYHIRANLLVITVVRW